MRLGYFTMPVHPMDRDLAETLREDREAVILADKLGFYDAFVGEHLTDKCETITNSMMFHASLIPSTKNIKLATGTTNLSHIHPVVIAQHAAMFDHLSEGRFILGVSPGALTSDAEALGILEQDRNKMFAEAIDVILAIWERDPPYDIDFPDNRYKVSTARTIDLPLGIGYLFKPYQKPRPEIVGTVVQPFSPGVVHMGRRDFHPLSANFLLSQHLKSHWLNYSKGKAEAGVEPKVEDWRIARTICVADDDKTAARYGREDDNSPYKFYWHQMYSKMKRGKRLYVFKSHKDQPDDEITLDYVLDHCMIHGSVNKVVDGILALREEVGDFGEIVYAGMDWVDPALEKRSMTLMAEQVLPRVNAAIGKSAAA
jgi:alkanesulfonate monooxygenase SsuD/methylene tetrahydromethanopterin reductase-like flavin-dependent oxidoreductase (luciferase family)